MDVTPLIPEGKQVIESYGERRFRISGRVHEGSVIVFPERTVAWEVSDFSEHFYICGPEAFSGAIKGYLINQGAAEAQIQIGY